METTDSLGEDESSVQRIGKKHQTFQNYMPKLLNTLKFHAVYERSSLHEALLFIANPHPSRVKSFSKDVPNSFIPPRWKKSIVLEDGTFDRKMYELCVWTEMKSALRSGDMWVEHSRKYRSFESRPISKVRVATIIDADELTPLPSTSSEYLSHRLKLLKSTLKKVDQAVSSGKLPDIVVKDKGLSIKRDRTEPNSEATLFIEKVATKMPRIKITDLLAEVDQMTNFSTAFTHLKRGGNHGDKRTLLTTILANGINLGLKKMAEAVSGLTYSTLQWTQGWYIREETYQQALAIVTNAQTSHPFAQHWGDGTASSSDGQRFATGSRGRASGACNPKYGSAPGRLYYTHVSDQYAPFYTTIVPARLRDSTYVLDGLLYHQSDLEIQSHSTDTAGFTDHVFGLMHLLGFQFTPRIKDLKETKLFLPEKMRFKELTPQIGKVINTKLIEDNWDDLRVVLSIREGTVTASDLIHTLANYPQQNRLASALAELGKMERPLFILEWYSNPEMRRKTTAELNKGESRNGLARAVHFHRNGEIRDRKWEQQLYRASGLSLVTSAIILKSSVKTGFSS